MRQEVESVIKNSRIDETKLPEVMRIIERAAGIMEEWNCDTDSETEEELIALQNEMRQLTGKEDYDIKDVNQYWSYTSLETKAAQVLMQAPRKCGLSQEALRELIVEIFRSGDLEKEALFDYWMVFLELETGIENVIGYLFSNDDKGGVGYASVNEVMERIQKGKALARQNVILL